MSVPSIRRISDFLSKPYFDHGNVNLDSIYAPYQTKVDELFRKNGFDEDLWSSMYFEGAVHNEASWSKRFPSVLKFVLAGKKE